VLIAIRLDCQENGFSPVRHKDAFALGKQLGFRLAGHCGEDDRPAYIWKAIQECGLERIDHGVRTIEDLALVHF